MCNNEEDIDIEMIARTIIAKYGKEALEVARELEKITRAPEQARAVTLEVMRLMKNLHH